MRLLLILIHIALFVQVSAQEVEIIVKNTDTEEEIPYMNVCTESISGKVKKFEITGKDGKLHLNLDETSLISISGLGFEALADTIHPGTRTKTFYLKPAFFELESVVVTGQYKPVKVDQSIYEIKLIGSDRIESKSVVDLAGILSDELGVRLNHDPSTGTSLKLQGISGENIKILLDGVPVIGRLDGNIDLSQISLDNVSHIEMVEGPMSVVYGSNALGGVINIITKKDTRSSYSTNLNSYYESVGIYNVNLLTSMKHKKNSFELNGGRNFFSGYSRDSSRSKEWKPKEQYNAGATWYYTGDKTRFRYKTDFFRERLLDRNEPYPPYFEKANDTWFYTNRLNNSLDLTRNISDNANFQVLTAYSYYARKKMNYLVDLTDLSSQLTTMEADHDTSTFHSIMSRGVYNYTPSNQIIKIQSGFDLNYETAQGKRIEDNQKTLGDYALFSSALLETRSGFSLQTGLRLAYNTRYRAPVVPSLNLMYKRGGTTFRGSYARGFRAPSLKELYLFFYDSNHQIEGNENLEAERSHNLMFSANRKITAGRIITVLDLRSFYNLIENDISLVQVDPDNLLHYRNENTGKFESIGYEVSGSIYRTSMLRFNAGYSHTGIRDELLDNTNFIFYTTCNASTELNFLKNTAKLSVFYKYYGKYPGPPVLMESGELERAFLDPFHNMDISISKKFLKNYIFISTGVKNLFDNKEIAGLGTGSSHGSSEGVSSLVGWGRTYFVNLKINIRKF